MAAALAHRDHGEPGQRRRPGRPAAGRPRAPPRGCRPRGRRARRPRRRGRGGGSGRGRRAAAAAGGTPPAARPPPRRPGASRPASVVRVGADGAQQRRRAPPRPPAGSSPSAGSVSSRQCSGCRTRWSESASLAPSTQSSRIAVPSSSTSASSSAAGSSSDRRVSRTRPASASSGSAVRASSASSGSAASPSRRERGQRGVRVQEPESQQVALAGRRPRHRSGVLLGERGEPGRQRPPGVVELGARGVDRRAAARRCRCRGSRGEPRSDSAHGCSTGTSTSGCSCTPHIAGAKRTACTSPCAGLRRAASRPSGSAVTTSSFHCTPRRGVASGPSSRSPAAASVQPSAEQPDLLAARVALDACRRARPRSAGGPGRCRASAARVARPSRTSSLTGPSQACASSSSAPIGPPRTSSPSYAARSGSVVAGVRAAYVERRSRPRSSQSPNSAGGHSRVVLDDEHRRRAHWGSLLGRER